MTRSCFALLSAAVVGAALVLPAPARAEGDTAADATATLTALETAMKAKDESSANAAIKKLPALYKGTADKGVQGSIASALGKAVKQKAVPGVRKNALDALVETDDGPTAWKGLSNVYPDNDTEDAEKFNVEIVKAVGALHPEEAIDKLLETFKKAKQAELAGQAALSLGNYHKSKRREQIFEELIKTGRVMKPGTSKTQNVSAEAQARWTSIGGSLGKGLDMLTGQTVGDPIDWFKKYDESKKNLKALFKD